MIEFFHTEIGINLIYLYISIAAIKSFIILKQAEREGFGTAISLPKVILYSLLFPINAFVITYYYILTFLGFNIYLAVGMYKGEENEDNQ